jgi:hypothetical protein
MTNGIKSCRRFLSSVVGAVGLLLVLLPSPVKAQKCTNDNGEFVFAHKTYKVRKVRVESIIDFLHAISSQLNAFKPDLPLQPGNDFDLDKSNQGRKLIENKLKEAEANAEPLTRLLIVRGAVENCDDPGGAEPKLDVVYRVLTTNYNAYLSHTWELKQAEIEQPATTAATEQAKGFLSIRPFLNFNNTRQLFGGAQVILRTPGGVFDSLRLAASGSTKGNVEDFELSSSRQPKMPALETLEYRIGYEHSDLPAETNRLRTGTFFGQMFGASPPLGSKGIILRYGAMLEGGNQQTDLVAQANAAGSDASSGYGGLKTYIGASLRRNAYSLAASYGLQLGTRGATSKVDFTKHIANASFTAEWALGEKNRTCGEPHKPLTLEAEFAAGRIQSRGLVPVSQRFFGGNAEQEFIAGDTWSIRSDPYIRSIPEHRLNAQTTLGAIGGTAFYSVNLTAAVPVWGRPIIPKEMEADPQFSLEAAKESTRQLLAVSFIGAKVPPDRFKPIIDALIDPTEHAAEPAANSVQVNMNLIGTLLEGLPEEVPNDPPLDPPCTPDDVDNEEPCTVYQKARTNVFILYETINLMLGDDEELKQRANLPGKLFILLQDRIATAGVVRNDPPCVVPDPELNSLPSQDLTTCATDPDKCSLISKLVQDVEKLAALLPRFGLSTQERQDSIQAISGSLGGQRTRLAPQLLTIDIHEAKEEADAVIKEIEPVLDAFQHKLNAYAISPVGIFDAARLWPDNNRTRYGVGGGLRLSIVNLNVTLGYAVNPKPQSREGRGAFFFKMDITDIFR